MTAVELRGRTAEHVRVFWEKTQDAEIKRLFPGGASSVEEALRWFQEAEMPNAASYGRTIFADGCYVGDIWCFGFEGEPATAGMLSFVVFEKTQWGRGIASEAVRLFLRDISERYSLDRLGAFVYSDNAASLRVLEKNGFVRQETFEEHGRESGYWECVVKHGVKT